ncbi:hypothetical protein [Micromonospora sp. WMMD1274]|uniref:hypothetical protein n=1 Tax=Micromonospora sp. WMMD1274 TaxID=3404116 RepID=UPI003B944F0E
MLAYMRRSSLGRVTPDDAWIQSTRIDVDAFGVLQRRFEHVNDFPEVFRKTGWSLVDGSCDAEPRAVNAYSTCCGGVSLMIERRRLPRATVVAYSPEVRSRPPARQDRRERHPDRDGRRQVAVVRLFADGV